MKQAFTGLILAAMTALVLSCTTEKADDFVPVIGGSSGSTGVAGGGSIPYTVDPGTTCPMPHVTRTCTCNKDGQEVPGRQVCKGLPGWGTCECAAVPESIVTGTTSAIGDPAKNKGAATFEWQRTVPEGSCEAGFYQGSFTGIYNSQVLITLTIGFAPSLPVLGDVSVTIEEKPGSNGEYFTISDGHFSGSALMAFPFDGDFRGELDCSARFFTGELLNCYYMVGADKYAFQGVAYSKYDVVNHAFVSGVWSVTEPVGEALFDSPLYPDAGYPDDSEFPPPLDVQAGAPLPAVYPVGFEGGTGDWTATFAHP